MGMFIKINTDPLKVLESARFTVLWSGGKDSTAALLWVLDHIRHDDWNVLYIEVTGNTHPMCTQYVIETARQLGIYNKLIIRRREDVDFFECLKQYGLPIIRHNRWCLHKFKLPFMLRDAHRVHVLGVRREESRARSLLYSFVVYSMQEDRLLVCPIFDWKSEHVEKYMKEHSVELNPCYSIYGHSGNCMFCPNHSKDKAYKTLLDPEWRAKIVDALKAQRGKHRIVKMWLRLADQIEKTKPLI